VAVSLNDVSDEVVTVEYATVDGTAVAGTNYTPVSGTLTFAPGQTLHPVQIAILNNTQHQPNRAFWLLLQTPSQLTIGTPSAEVVILDNDEDNGGGTNPTATLYLPLVVRP
jgi:hypothetical protein